MIRWILAFPFFLLFGFIAGMHLIGTWLFYVKKQKNGSMLPLLGGALRRDRPCYSGLETAPVQ